MAKMHANEIDIDINKVRSLIENQCSHFANLTIQTVKSNGTDNALFRLGNKYIVRLPRVEWEVEGNEKNISKEYKWLPQLARLLKISISEPLFKGNSDQSYPWPWLISKWNEGKTPDFEKENEYNLLAKDLANFLNELHSIDLPNGPFSRRGVSLKEVDVDTHKAIRELKNEITYFYEGYGDVNIDKKLLAYYRCERIIEDIALYAEDIFSSKNNEAEKLISFTHFKSMFEPNGVVEIALRNYK